MTVSRPAPVAAAIPVILAALSMIGPFSIDTYLPAFPALAADLGASQLEVQQTLTAYLLPFAVMMLWHGALADALGRRRVILGGLALYILASLFCACATRIEYLWLGRALQGVSAGVGMVVSRAIVRDLLDGAAAQRLMARISILFAIAPAIAPILGGWLHALFGWHGIFVFLGIFGAALWFAALRHLPETLPADQRQPLHPRHLWQAYRTVFADREFMRLSWAQALNFNGMFLYVLSAPMFLIGHLGLSPQGFGWLFLPGVGGMMCGAFLSGRFAGKLSARRTIAIGTLIMGGAVLLNLALNLLLPPGLPWSILPFPLYTIGMALTMPSMQLLALDLYPEKRGLASSCLGVVQTGSNVLTAALLAPLLWTSPLLLACGMAGFFTLGLAIFLVALRRYRTG